MATGDQDDIAGRLRSVIPPSWFPDAATRVSGVLQGFARVGAFIYGLIALAKLQTRRLTASGIFLDLYASDYFGRLIRRRAGELDLAFRARIGKEILRERVTRAGMVTALTDLTGRAPAIFEPWSPQDGGGLGTGALALSGGGQSGAGGVGSIVHPAQVFITAYRPGVQGVPGISGLGAGAGGVGVGALALTGPSMVLGAVTDADIYATINATKPSGVICWVKLL